MGWVLHGSRVGSRRGFPEIPAPVINSSVFRIGGVGELKGGLITTAGKYKSRGKSGVDLYKGGGRIRAAGGVAYFQFQRIGACVGIGIRWGWLCGNIGSGIGHPEIPVIRGDIGRGSFILE